MKYYFLLFSLFVFTFLSAQENYDWESIQEVKFYKLPGEGKINQDSIAYIIRDVKAVHIKDDVWKKILLVKSTNEKDIVHEKNRYMIIIKFKNAEIIPFQLFSEERALFDLRKDHFNFVIISRQVYPIFDKTIKAAIFCSENRDCSTVR